MHSDLKPLPLLLVLLQLSEQPNEAEGQRGARAAPAHYIHPPRRENKTSNTHGSSPSYWGKKQTSWSWSPHACALQSLQALLAPLKTQQQIKTRANQRQNLKTKTNMQTHVVNISLQI